MIRTIAPNEAAQVFGLMNTVYANHSLINQGIDAYQKQLKNGEYVSLGNFDEEGKLSAHAGYQVHPDFALISALVVDPTMRETGLGRSVFQARLEHIEASRAFNFIAGYSMTQHLASQQLYSDAFKPIGLDIGYPDIYRQSDTKYNRGNGSNAEIVLCRRISTQAYAVEVALRPQDRDLARHILNSLGIDCEFSDSTVRAADETFLGFHPDAKEGLFIPAFLGRSATVNFNPLLTSNEDRGAFIASIKGTYE